MYKHIIFSSVCICKYMQIYLHGSPCKYPYVDEIVLKKKKLVFKTKNFLPIVVHTYVLDKYFSIHMSMKNICKCIYLYMYACVDKDRKIVWNDWHENLLKEDQRNHLL